MLRTVDWEKIEYELKDISLTFTALSINIKKTKSSLKNNI